MELVSLRFCIYFNYLSSAVTTPKGIMSTVIMVQTTGETKNKNKPKQDQKKIYFYVC